MSLFNVMMVLSGLDFPVGSINYKSTHLQAQFKQIFLTQAIRQINNSPFVQLQWINQQNKKVIVSARHINAYVRGEAWA